METACFYTLAFPGKPLSRTCLLLSSLRAFGGTLAASPVWVMTPESQGDFSPAQIGLLEDLGAEIVPFQDLPGLLRFPLGAKVQAAAAAEIHARERAELLVWLDEDTLVLGPLDEFSLPDRKALGYRPVHHKLLGTSWGEEPGEFWQLAYQRCGASPAKDFPMETHAGERIRPYFNAGCYSIKPGMGLLSRWWEVFRDCYQSEDFQAYYQQDPRYAVFLHQAIFTGLIISSLEKDDLQEFSPRINYPLHLHGDVPPGHRVDRLDDLVTARYEDLLSRLDWGMLPPGTPALINWIADQRNRFFKDGEGS